MTVLTYRERNEKKTCLRCPLEGEGISFKRELCHEAAYMNVIMAGQPEVGGSQV